MILLNGQKLRLLEGPSLRSEKVFLNIGDFLSLKCHGKKIGKE